MHSQPRAALPGPRQFVDGFRDLRHFDLVFDRRRQRDRERDGAFDRFAPAGTLPGADTENAPLSVLPFGSSGQRREARRRPFRPARPVCLRAARCPAGPPCPSARARRASLSRRAASSGPSG